MFETLVENMEESIKKENINANEEDNLLDEELDELLDEGCGKKCKTDPAEKESPRDEALVFNFNGEVKEFDAKAIANMFKNESLGEEPLTDNDLMDYGVMPYSESLDREKNLQESIDEALILNENATYKFDKSVAESNVKLILEKKNDKMKKKGYLPLTSVNSVLKATIAELKAGKGFTNIKAIKISGVVCLQYVIGNEDYKNIGVCYFNKETSKIRVFNVKASVRIRKEEISDESIIHESSSIF